MSHMVRIPGLDVLPFKMRSMVGRLTPQELESCSGETCFSCIASMMSWIFNFQAFFRVGRSEHICQRICSPIKLICALIYKNVCARLIAEELNGKSTACKTILAQSSTERKRRRKEK